MTINIFSFNLTFDEIIGIGVPVAKNVTSKVLEVEAVAAAVAVA